MCFEWKNRFTCGHIGFNKVERCNLLGTGCYGPDGTEKFLEFGRLCYDCNARLLDPIPVPIPLPMSGVRSSDPFFFQRAMTVGHFAQLEGEDSASTAPALEGTEAADARELGITAGGEGAGDGGEGEGEGEGGRGEELRGRARAPGSERGAGGRGGTARGTAAAAAAARRRPGGREGVLAAGPPAPAQVGSPGNMSVGSLARSGSRSGSASSGQEGN